MTARVFDLPRRPLGTRMRTGRGRPTASGNTGTSAWGSPLGDAFSASGA